MIDIHSHILYGVDDGARSYEESIEMLKGAKALGYTTIIATSHYPGIDEEARISAYESLKKAAGSMGMDILLGREVMVTPETVEEIEDDRIDPFGRGKGILIEFQPGMISQNGLNVVKRITEAGYTPVIAHVERYSWKREDLLRLKEAGGVLQMNIRAAASGRPQWYQWIEEGIIDVLATDSHRSSGRSYILGDEMDLLKSRLGEDEFRRLTEINPKRLIEGMELVRGRDLPQKRVGILGRFLMKFSGKR